MPLEPINPNSLGTLKIEASKTFERVPCGVYECVFKGANPKTLTSDGKEKATTEWRFEVVKAVGGGGSERSGDVIDGLADLPPTTKNKLGRWPSGLAGQPMPLDGSEVRPDDYVGRKYMVVVSPSPKTGKPALSTFSPMSA